MATEDVEGVLLGFGLMRSGAAAEAALLPLQNDSRFPTRLRPVRNDKLCESLQQALPQNAQFLADREAHSTAEDVVPAFRDFLEQTAINVNQYQQSRLAVFRNIRNQLFARLIEVAGAVRFERQ